MRESAYKRVSLLRPLARIDVALYGWLSRPSRIAATRIFVSSVMVFIGLLFLGIGLLAHFAPGH